MKRIISALLCAILVISLIPSAMATDSELTELVKFAKGVLSVPDEYTEFESSKGESFGETVYSLMWSIPDKNSRIYCEILSSGEIVAYEASKDVRDTDFVSASFEREEYLKLAADWIKRVNPKYAKELDFDGEVTINGSSHIVRVVFARKLSGIPVYGNAISFSLDKGTGEITRMYVNFDISDKVESEEGTIDAETAKEKLHLLFAPTLKYKKLYDEKRAVLVYEPLSRGDMIAARDGEKFTVTYLNTDFSLMKDEAASESVTGEGNASLNRAEISAIEEIESLLTKQEVSDIINKMAGTVVARYNLRSLYYTKTEKTDGENFYSATAMLKGDGNAYGEVILNARTGELLNLYSYDGSLASKKTKVSEEELLKTADRFVKNFAPAEYEKAKVSETAYGGRYVFTEHVNGIEYDANRITVYVNEKNGKVMSFSKSWEDGVEFDTTENIISAADAWNAFVGEDGCVKYYIADGLAGYGNRAAEEFRLIWKLSDETPAYVDAKTGDVLGWDLKATKEEGEYKPQPDLSGHFAEASVKKLANNGIILSKKEKFSPDETLTKSEMVYLLFMFERGYYIEPTDDVIESFYEEAYARGILVDEKKNPDPTASREVAASAIVNLLGYKKAAEITGIYKTGFSDEGEVSKEYLGGVAIAKGLGIVNGVPGGKFAPHRAVTRGEFAVMLANCYGK